LLAIGTILDNDRMANVLDADLVDGEFARIRRSLDIGDGRNRLADWLSVHYLILLQILVVQ
jgi:hypothetical protein